MERLATLETRFRALGVGTDFMVIGGCASAAYLFDDVGIDVRATDDVDLVVPGRRVARDQLLSRLANCGVGPEAGDPIGRVRVEGMPVDLVDGEGQWLESALKDRQPFPGLELSVIDPVAFVATKLVALKAPDRGAMRAEPFVRGYAQGSSDLEDVIQILGGIGEVQRQIVSRHDAMVRFIRFELVTHLVRSGKGLALVEGNSEPDAVSQKRAERLWAWLCSLNP